MTTHKIIARVAKPIKGGRTSTWRFRQSNRGQFTAVSSAGKLIVLKTEQEMQNLYANMIGYGYKIS
tara:strand:- start:215 stop:412 length:198 start_codon:yes stop_codon:yes gene_type:complete